MLYVFLLIFSVLLIAVQVVQVILVRRERKFMTIEKFKRKCDEFIKKNDVSGVTKFLQNHMIFVLTHSSEISEFLNSKKSFMEVKQE